MWRETLGQITNCKLQITNYKLQMMRIGCGWDSHQFRRGIPLMIGAITAVAFSPDSARLATGGFDGLVRIYNVADCTLIHSFVPAPLSAGVVDQ